MLPFDSASRISLPMRNWIQPSRPWKNCCHSLEDSLENRKDKNFDTIEIAYDINNVLSISDTNSTYLLDSLTALVLNEMFKYENKLSNDELTNKINNDLDELCKNVDNIVIVTDYIFSDAIYVSQFTEDYLKIFANVSCHLAQISDCVIECVVGCHKFIKGKI